MPLDITFKTDSDPSNFTTKTYNDQNYINVEGDTLQGSLDLNNHKITNVGTPTDDNDCSTKGYVDNLILCCWPKLNEPPLKNDKKCFINQNTHMFQLIQYKLSHQMIFSIIVCFTI